MTKPPPTSPSLSDSPRLAYVVIAMLLLAVVAMAIYFPVLGVPFFFDDRTQIVNNPVIHHLKKAFSFQSDRRVVVRLSIWVNHALGGLNPVGYRLFNIGVHVAAAMTLMGLAMAAMGSLRYRHIFGRWRLLVAFAIAMLWMVHPLQTQSVAYVIQRAESLAALFLLWTLGMLWIGAQAHTSAGRWLAYLGAATCALLAVMSKEYVIGLPILALLFDRTYLAGSFGKAIRQRWPVHLLIVGAMGYLFYAGVMGHIFPKADAAAAAATPVAVAVAEESGNATGDEGEVPTRNDAEEPLSATDDQPSLAPSSGGGALADSTQSVSLTDANVATVVTESADPPLVAFVTTAADPEVEALLSSTIAGGGDFVMGFGGHLSGVEYLLTQAEVIPRYVRLVFWPDPLVIDYGWPMVRLPDENAPGQATGEDVSFLARREVRAAGWGLLVLAGFAVSCVAVWRWPWAGFLGVTFYVVLGPTSSVLPIADAYMEHRMYLPSAMVIALVVIGVAMGLRRLALSPSPSSASGGPARVTPRGAAMIGAVLMLVAAGCLSMRTLYRWRDYESPLTLWRSVVEVAPNYSRALQNYGAALYELGVSRRDEAMQQEAEHYLVRAIKANPGEMSPYLNLSSMYFEAGRLDESERYARFAYQRRTRHGMAQLQLAKIQRRRGDLPDAERLIREAIAESFLNIQAYDLLGIVLREQGRLSDAEATYRYAITLNPGSEILYLGFSDALGDQGKLDEALAAANRALEMNAQAPQTWTKVGQFLARKGDFVQASTKLQEALRLKPDHAPALRMLAGCELKLGRPGAAVNLYRHAIAIEPNHVTSLRIVSVMLASNRSPLVRNGPLALQYAAHAMTLTDGADASVVEAYAAALAEVMRFEDAVAAQASAVELFAAGGGSPARVAAAKERLEMYRRRQPLRGR